MKKAKELVEKKLLPRKLAVSKSFNVDRRKVKVETAYSPIDGLVAVNVRVTDPHKPVKFGMLTSLSFDPIECKVFGTSVVSCGLADKLPQCKGCALNTHKEAR
jgi:hypothetical protein